MKHKLEVISKAVAEKLESHAQVIHTLIAAQRRGAAEQFGYAFLTGRALLQAKAIVPNGNSRIPNRGFKNWVAANLPEISLRTAENWMHFAESILSRAQVDACNAPLFLGSVEINGSAQESILKLVPEIMDGRGMMRFMRDSRLLRAPQRPQQLSADLGPAQDAPSPLAARSRRRWERVIGDLDGAENMLPHVESAADLARYLGCLKSASRKLRAALNARKCSLADGGS